jgi:hypothetical protein
MRKPAVCLTTPHEQHLAYLLFEALEHRREIDAPGARKVDLGY